MDPTVVTCRACLIGEQLEILEPAVLLLAGGFIKAIAPSSSVISAPSRAQYIDLQRAIVLPALVNAHVHLRDAVAPEAGVGLPLAESVMGPQSARGRAIAKATRDQRVVAMRDALAYMATLGISLVGDFSDGGAEGVREVKDAAKDLTIDLVALGRLDTTVRGMPRPIPRLSADQHRELEAVLDVADGFAAATMNEFSDDAWREIAHAAQSVGKLLAVHAAEDRQHLEASRCATGRTDIERAVAMGADHVVHLTAAERDDLLPVVNGRVPVVTCPRSNGITGSGFPPIRPLLEAGGTVALGTDNVMINTPDLWREMEYASKALRAIDRDPLGITPRQLLRAATAGGAAALGRGQRSGTIEVGKLANLIAVDLDAPPLRRTTDVVAGLVHRVTPECILGRFHAGRWLPNR